MAEKKGVGHACNVDFLNVVFAASSLFLFISGIWMVWDDCDREWKKTQRHFVDLQVQVTQAQLQQKLTEADNTLFRATLDYNYMKATYDQDRYAFEAARANGSSSAASLEKTQADEATKLAELNLAMEKATADKAAIQKQLGDYT